MISIQVKMKSSETNSYLLFFDFDRTITNDGSLSKLIPLITDKNSVSEINSFYQKCSYIKMFNKIFDSLKKKYTFEQVKSSLKENTLSPGMLQLLEYLKKNNKKFISYVLTSNTIILVSEYLKSKELLETFSDVIGIKSVFENDFIKIAQIDKECDCDLCTDICKTFEANKIIEKYKNENKNIEKVIFVCDGGNDYCFARNLKENDILFVRKNFGLEKKLKNEGYIKNLKCKVIYWESGIEIKNFLDNII